jgi:uncharacterized protein
MLKNWIKHKEIFKLRYDTSCLQNLFSRNMVKSRHLKGLKAFMEDFPKVKAILVSLDKYPGILNGVEIIPVEQFLKLLWNNEIFDCFNS